LAMNRADELRTDQADADGFHGVASWYSRRCAETNLTPSDAGCSKKTCEIAQHRRPSSNPCLTANRALGMTGHFVSSNRSKRAAVDAFDPQAKVRISYSAAVSGHDLAGKRHFPSAWSDGLSDR